MTLTQLHTHFQWQGVDFLHLSENYDNSIYGKNGKEVTIPKIEDGELKPELIIMACMYLEVDVPIGIEIE